MKSEESLPVSKYSQLRPAGYMCHNAAPFMSAEEWLEVRGYRAGTGDKWDRGVKSVHISKDF